MKPILYILCGPSGCGKTTWANNFIKDNDVRYVSRDDIRYSLLKDDEPYFSHEKEVFKKFIGTIAQTLIDGFDVIADATHLNEISRYKLTGAIDHYIKDYSIIYVEFRIGIKTALEQNHKRTGRAQIADEIIKQMYANFQHPMIMEDTRAIDIIEVSEKNLYPEGDDKNE